MQRFEEERAMIPIISVVGRSNAGKTTLIERLIAELLRRGYRVGTIKHNRHGFEIDHEGKDSWRHRKAGAAVTVIASPAQIAVVEDAERDYGIAELAERYIRGVDLVISEGFKKNNLPKIEVWRPSEHQEFLCEAKDNLIAIASDQPVERGVPRFALDDIPGITDLIEKRILKKGSSD
ncbi:MAG: molybdopterin-guanine dinucleotide biosynthesis protein B [Syntrophales bacterium]|jgi:molybdopterin-guanine dinucleotide biosynthesis protein MobB|nr:molybdopterin-guanine dinucleotide biosynthesis protein B [Syntrophales bacterium]